jgi:hypothetical protein
MSDSDQWFDHQIGDLSPQQRAELDRALRSEGIPATFGPAAVRTDVAYEARVTTLIAQARAVPATPAAPNAPPAYPGPNAAYAPAYPTAAPTNSNAIVALILGVAGLVVCQLAGPAAVLFGMKARREIRQTGEQGDGLALAGLITGAIASAILALFVVGLVVLVIIAAASSS